MQRTIFSNRVRLMAAVLSAAAILPSTGARATTFLDILFGNHQRTERMGRGYYDDQGVDPSSIKRVHVSGPRYYTYKPDQLVKIDFNKLDPQITSSANADSNGATSLSLQPDVFAEALNALKATDVRATKDIAQAIVEYYSSHHAFIWVDGYNADDKAAKVAAYLAKTDEDGLDPADYTVSLPSDGFDISNLPARLQMLANFEVAMTARVLRYASDASNGRVIADRISGYHDLPRRKLDFKAILEKLASDSDPTAYLASLEPQNKWYTALKGELAKLDASNATQEDPITIAPGTLIHPGDDSAELPKVIKLIRKRASADFIASHGDVLDAYDGQTTYGKDLVAVVKDFQKEAGRQSDGIIGRNTIASLVGDPPSLKRDRILYAMERLRWLPHDLGNRFVLVNEPAFHAGYFANGDEKLGMKVVVGKPNHQTYFFTNRIQKVVFNPAWGVPRSIIFNEMMPKILADPSYLSRSGYEVTDNRGNPIPSDQIDWVRIAQTGGDVNIKQLPGASNALGRLKILFPNSHDIYMHDTPQKSYFKRSVRALSHGCIRLQHPQEMAAAVMGTSVSDLQPYFSKEENTIPVAHEMPIYVTYFTAWPNAATGMIDYYDDIYDRDGHLQKALDATHAVRAETS